MNIRVTKILVMAGVIIMTAAYASYSQTQDQYRANIPFDFMIGDRSFRAGEYSIAPLSPASQSKVIVLRDTKGRKAYAMVPQSIDSKSRQAILTFRRYASRYFLAEVRTGYLRVQFTPSLVEEGLAKETERQRETVALSKF